MVYPTFSLLIAAAISAAVLLAADWYVWGLTYANDFRQPHPVNPQGSGEVVEGMLAHFVATAETHVPHSDATRPTATASASTQDERHGFKQVA